jgi:DNA-directed RNA polymerase specialized sigma24 family protein
VESAYVDPHVSTKQEWVITQEAFERLLASLDADRERAGQEYVRLRLKLVKYFEWHRAAFPDRAADVTINRVARRIEEGQEVNNVSAYCYGVARLVFAESLRVQQKEREAFGFAPVTEAQEAETDLDAEVRRACLDRCLQELPEESRDLILGYYEGEGGAKIECRKRLAARLGIQLNALRIRAHRIRVGLESCVRACAGQQA